MEAYDEWLEFTGSECSLYCCPRHGCLYPEGHEHDNGICPVKKEISDGNVSQDSDAIKHDLSSNGC